MLDSPVYTDASSNHTRPPVINLIRLMSSRRPPGAPRASPPHDNYEIPFKSLSGPAGSGSHLRLFLGSSTLPPTPINREKGHQRSPHSSPESFETTHLPAHSLARRQSRRNGCLGRSRFRRLGETLGFLSPSSRVRAATRPHSGPSRSIHRAAHKTNERQKNAHK